jgi:hypothetical protein
MDEGAAEGGGTVYGETHAHDTGDEDEGTGVFDVDVGGGAGGQGGEWGEKRFMFYTRGCVLDVQTHLRRFRVKAMGLSFDGSSFSQFTTRGMTNLRAA